MNSCCFITCFCSSKSSFRKDLLQDLPPLKELSKDQAVKFSCCRILPRMFPRGLRPLLLVTMRLHMYSPNSPSSFSKANISFLLWAWFSRVLVCPTADLLPTASLLQMLLKEVCGSIFCSTISLISLQSFCVFHIFKVLIQITILVSLLMCLLSPWRGAVIFVVIWA